MTAGEVVERIKGRVGIPWMTETVDRIVAGSPEVRVKGIATTMMATLEVIQRAVAAGRNMIVTHEPTFWSHLDTTKELEGDPTYEFKRRFIAEHDVAVFRFHDHWHRMKPDGINVGMTRELGWEKNAVSEGSHEFVFDVATVGGLVETMAKRLNAHSMRVVGDAKMPVKRVVANWGYASLMLYGLRTWWVGAVGTSALEVHVSATALAGCGRGRDGRGSGEGMRVRHVRRGFSTEMPGTSQHRAPSS